MMIARDFPVPCFFRWLCSLLFSYNRPRTLVWRFRKKKEKAGWRFIQGLVGCEDRIANARERFRDSVFRQADRRSLFMVAHDLLWIDTSMAAGWDNHPYVLPGQLNYLGLLEICQSGSSLVAAVVYSPITTIELIKPRWQKVQQR